MKGILLGGRGFLPAKPGYFDDSPAVEPIVSIDLAVTNAVYSHATDRVYVVNSDGVVVVNPKTGEVTDRVGLSNEPRVLGLSEEDLTLYIGYGDINEIQPLNLSTLQLGEAFTLGNDPSGGSRFAADIEPVPGEMGVIVVSMSNNLYRHAGVAVFDNGVRRPHLTPDHQSSNHILFTDDGRLYGQNTDSSGFELRELVVDAQGVSEIDVVNAFAGGAVSLISAGNRILASNGRLMDFDQRRVIGKLGGKLYERNQGRCVSVDAHSGRSYCLGNHLTTYDTDRFVPLSVYQSPLIHDPIRLLNAPDFLILLSSSELMVVDKLDLQDYELRRCRTMDLSVFDASTGARRIECSFNAAIYDPTRNKILASTPSDMGLNGNSIAIIDAETAEIDTFIPVGSEPGKLSLSADASQVFVALGGSNTFAELNLTTHEVTIRGNFLDPITGPVPVENVTASPVNPQDVIVGPQGLPTVLISDGVQAPNVVLSGAGLVKFLPDDPTVAYGLDFGRLTRMTVSSEGLTTNTDVCCLVSGFDFTFYNRRMYTSDGDRLELDNLVVDGHFNLDEGPFITTFAESVAVDQDHARVLFFSRSGTQPLLLFDDKNQTLFKAYELFNLAGLSDVQGILAELPSDFVIVDGTAILLLPKAEVNQW